MSELDDLYEEDPQPEPPPVDPDNPDWVILPVKRGVTESFTRVWALCQKYGAHIIGGYVRYMISPDNSTAKSNDIDIFMGSIPEGFTGNVQTRFDDLELELSKLYEVEHTGPLSYYFHDEEGDEPAVNLVIPRVDERMVTFGSVYDILEFFDFPVVRCALKNLEEAIADPDFLEDEGKKNLRWKNINCPIAAVFRALKYYKKGYFPRPREILKLFQDWDERDQGYKDLLANALNREDLTEEDLMNLERLLWVD